MTDKVDNVVDSDLQERAEKIKMKTIRITQNKRAIVDPEDYDFLNRFKWYAQKNGNTYYAYNSAVDIKIAMHHFIMGFPLNKKQIDHINHNGLDNRKKNLRIVTNRTNSSHRLGKKTSKYVGVCWHKHNKRWIAAIRINRIKYYLGSFYSQEKAYQAYQNRLHRLNSQDALASLRQARGEGKG